MNDQVLVLCKHIPASNRIELTELLFNLFLCDKNALETVNKQTNKQNGYEGDKRCVLVERKLV